MRESLKEGDKSVTNILKELDALASLAHTGAASPQREYQVSLDKGENIYGISEMERER